MRATTVTGILAAVASQVFAQDLAYPNQTAPFRLILRSKRSNLNGSALSTCHEGAAIEGLCVSTAFTLPLRLDTYSLNYSSYQEQFINSTLGINGLLTWDLPIIMNGQPTNISSGL